MLKIVLYMMSGSLVFFAVGSFLVLTGGFGWVFFAHRWALRELLTGLAMSLVGAVGMFWSFQTYYSLLVLFGG